ncbi:trafficking protein particle complex subunit 13 isoform X6 [Carcharodon carcharias]|uniref:trafficking protein particle complex subunit 13 isoform X6 n=1 Tax=Carcharodon carcharias TaxID=13397 RepID=UPI001B7F4D58|nr:trafficking protein particle complex subunit 13 isoform X6 [Carcharodon carcharias]
MELMIHYRPNQDCPEVLKIAKRLLEDFPQRTSPGFIPWFPNNMQSLPVKPEKCPPTISNEEAKRIEKYLVDIEFKTEAQNYDCTEDLLEFSANLLWDGPLTRVAAVEFLPEMAHLCCGVTDKEYKSERSWSIAGYSRIRGPSTLAVSQRLQILKEKLQLHSFQRAKWVIDQSNCSTRQLEEIWVKLSSIIKHGDLPGCNAKIHRHLGQIWVFCDLVCCEYVGNLIKQILNLTVMRLTKPTLFTNLPVTCEDRDLPGDLFSQLMKDDPSTVKGAETFMLGEMLTLPQNFGNIFLGETFSSYISVHNDSVQVVKDILVKADLQTSSQRLNLSASNAAVTELKPDRCIDDVIHHEVKEIGTHILVCAVSYTTQAGEKMYFRKFFKFQVLKPLDVKTKFYNAESDLSSVTDEVFLEAQIQNITTTPMYMEKVSLEPSIMYNVTELNTVNSGGNGYSTFGKMTYLQPMDTRQYLYCLKPKPEFAEKAGVIKGVTVIGKLDIVWKTNLGERGRLQTSQLQRMAPGYGDVRLSLEMIPDTVNLEEPFEVTCKITNCSERTMDLVLEMCNTNAIHWCGISGRQLGKLSPNSSLHLALKLLASLQGLQSISGLRLMDTFLKRTYEYDDIAQVCVVFSHLKPES